MTEADIAAEAKKIVKDYPLDERLVRRLIRVQVQKTQPAALYDLDYDVQLNEAIKAAQRKDFSTMLKNTKTLRQLQEEAEEAQAAESK
jgi:carboxyl-terminal processing protease